VYTNFGARAGKKDAGTALAICALHCRILADHEARGDAPHCRRVKAAHGAAGSQLLRLARGLDVRVRGGVCAEGIRFVPKAHSEMGSLV